MMANKKLKNAGFTLLELLASASIVTILLSVGVPSLSDTIRTNRLITQTNTFITTLNAARSEAVKQGRRVTVCKSADRNSCATSGTWEQGWIAFVDLDANGSRDISEGSAEMIVQSGHELSDGNKLTVVSGSDFDNYISYLATGRALGNNGNDSGTFKICDPQVSVVRKVEINITGRPQLERVTESCA